MEGVHGRATAMNPSTRTMEDGRFATSVPKGDKQMVDLQIDTMQEKYDPMKEKIITWATNACEKSGGPVVMDIGEIGEEFWDPWEDEWQDCEEGVMAISPDTQCYHCGNYGHMAARCPLKVKGKCMKGKGKGKGAMKGSFKGSFGSRG